MSKQAHCTSCGAPIVWVATEAKEGKPSRSMPLDGDPDNPGFARQDPTGNLVFTGAEEPGRYGDVRVVRYVPKGAGRHVSHFATCAQGASHRKKKR